ncbi:hypothetical protein GCM10009863_36390 [Streptomyces axinellae]|uniref:Resolvase/invertase-type recombinase catalytic domain-containing protein n=1 Tax=Streptomyces axinellae TaxID=552788 RepID=A0ABN3Q7Z7_9ACTN
MRGGAGEELRPEPFRHEARRTERGRRRRQALADHAAGHLPGEGDVPAQARQTARFRVVIYLCAAPTSDVSEPRREGLGRAVELVEQRRAVAVLTPWRSMISTIPQEYDELARDVEKAGGFLHDMDSDRARPHRR